MGEPTHGTASRKSGRRRINFRFAFWLLTGLLLVGGLTYGVRYYQVDRNARYVLQRARQHRDEGNAELAVRDYARYLQYRPDDLDALFEMGKVLENAPAATGGELLRVYLAYERVLREDPTRDDVRQRIVDVALRLSRYSVALAHLELLPVNADVVFQTAQCREGLGDYSRAAEGFLEAIEREPGRIEFYNRLVQLILRHGRNLPLKALDPLTREGVTEAQLAEYLMDEAARVGKPRFEAYLARARYRRQQGEFELAAADIQQAMELAGDHPEVLLTSSDVSLAQARAAVDRGADDSVVQGFFVEAAAASRRGLKAHPDDLRFFLSASRVEVERGRPEDAVELLRQGVERYGAIRRRDRPPEGVSAAELTLLSHQLTFSLADLLMTQAIPERGRVDPAKLAEADALIGRLPKRGPLESLARFLQARKAIVAHRWLDAIKIFEQTVAIEVPLTNLQRRIALEWSRCYEQLRNPYARYEVLSRTIDRDPLWMQGRIELADALADGGRLDEAIEQYRPFLRVPGVPTAAARLLMLQQLSRPASRRDWSEVEEVLRLAEQEVMPDSPEIPALRAELLAQQGSYSAARTLLTNAVAADGKFAEDVELTSTTARFVANDQTANRTDRIAIAAGILDEAEKSLGDHVDFRLARAHVATLQDFDAAVKDLVKLELGFETFSNDEQFTLLSGLAQTYARIKATEHARRVWMQLAKSFPENLMVRLVLIRFAADAGDEDERKRQLGEVRRIEGPDGPNGNYEEAVALLDGVRSAAAEGDSTAKHPSVRFKAELVKARALLDAAAKRRRNWAAVPRALGVLEDLAGNSGEAFEDFQRAIELGDRSREVITRVVNGLYVRQRYADADRELRRLAENSSEAITGDVARLAWRIAWQRQQYERALGIAGELAEESGDFRDLIWQAQLRFARDGLSQDVEKALRQAIEGGGKTSAAPWFAMVAYQFRIGLVDKARDTIAEAERTLPPRLAALTAGRCYEVIGDTERAEKKYLEALKNDPDDVSRLIAVADFFTRIGESAQARQYLDQIVGRADDFPESARAWARRRQVIIKAGQGSYEDLRADLRSLSHNVRGGSPTAERSQLQDLRTAAAIQSTLATRRDRQAAIRAYEELQSRGERLSAAERFRLAQMYDLTGEWNKARELLVALAADDSPDGGHVAYYALALLRREQLRDAAAWVDRLEELEPSTFRTAVARARMLAADGRPEEAVPILTGYIEQRRGAAESLNDLLAQGNAEEVMSVLSSYLRERLDRRGGQVMVQARALLKQQMTAEAVALLSEYIDARQLADASQAVLYRFSATLCEEIGQLEAAEEFFRKYAELSDNPRAIFLQAAFYARQARLDEAISLCRSVYDRPERDLDLIASAAASVVGHGEPTTGQLSEVKVWIENALTANPESTAANIALADLHLVQREFGDAEARYRRLLRLNSGNVPALNNLAWLLAYRKQNLPEARKLIGQAIDRAGPIAALLDTRAMIHLAAGDADAAVDDLTEAFVNTVSPYSALGHLHLAEALLMAGEKAKSAEMLARAEKLGLSVAGLHPLEREKYDQVRKSHPADEAARAALRRGS